MLPSLHSVAFAVAICLAPCQIQKLCSGTQPEEKPALKVKDKPTAFRGDNDIPTAFRGKVVELTDKAVTIKP